MTLRALLVDDHDAWRQRIAALLCQTEEWEVAAHATDGLAAAALAATLKPDLILLDLELPALNGLETAARILDSDPAARIVFLTAHRSWDIIEAALAGGARGYVVKAHAGSELRHAVRTVASGGRFVSEILGGRGVGGETDAVAPHHHEAAFREDEPALLGAYEQFAVRAFTAGKVVMGVATEARLQEISRRLQARGVDLERAIRDGQYRPIEVSEFLSAVMLDGRPDGLLFWKNVVALMMHAARVGRGPRPALAAFGQASDALWKTGRLDAAIELENLTDEFARTFNVDILCGYSLPDTSHPADGARERIAATHGPAHGL